MIMILLLLFLHFRQQVRNGGGLWKAILRTERGQELAKVVHVVLLSVLQNQDRLRSPAGRQQRGTGARRKQGGVPIRARLLRRAILPVHLARTAVENHLAGAALTWVPEVVFQHHVDPCSDNFMRRGRLVPVLVLLICISAAHALAAGAAAATRGAPVSRALVRLCTGVSKFIQIHVVPVRPSAVRASDEGVPPTLVYTRRTVKAVQSWTLLCGTKSGCLHPARMRRGGSRLCFVHSSSVFVVPGQSRGCADAHCLPHQRPPPVYVSPQQAAAGRELDPGVVRVPRFSVRLPLHFELRAHLVELQAQGLVASGERLVSRAVKVVPLALVVGLRRGQCLDRVLLPEEDLLVLVPAPFHLLVEGDGLQKPPLRVVQLEGVKVLHPQKPLLPLLLLLLRLVRPQNLHLAAAGPRVLQLLRGSQVVHRHRRSRRSRGNTCSSCAEGELLLLREVVVKIRREGRARAAPTGAKKMLMTAEGRAVSVLLTACACVLPRKLRRHSHCCTTVGKPSADAELIQATERVRRTSTACSAESAYKPTTIVGLSADSEHSASVAQERTSGPE
mmetsp:Transcript_12798/g.31164  ORF Transcript_12798/g.31164 Transcript_12798/m.31164 type:complete len:560 (+) Transcript_12798:1174-2853(+)